MNHYCTYFDSGYLGRGVALWISLKRRDPTAVLWVLCLDEAAADAIRRLGDAGLRAVTLSELEAADAELASAKNNRSRIEYIFTLSPCWSRWLLMVHPEIEVITYVDADMAFFSDPAPVFSDLGGADVLIVEHRFPPYLRHYEAHGRFNVGILCFRNSAEGRRCLDWWREQCLAWCHDYVENDRYADQKYLDEWPRRFAGVVICRHPGINLAPWNWMNSRYRFEGDRLLVDGKPLIIFHFALFKPRGRFLFDSGQLEYGVMPLRLRSWLYARYFALVQEAEHKLGLEAPRRSPARAEATGRRIWLELIFGSVWLRVGPLWLSGRLGLGRFSGRALSWARGNSPRKAS